jgi:hypothetical protein
MSGYALYPEALRRKRCGMKIISSIAHRIDAAEGTRKKRQDPSAIVFAREL